VLAVLRRLGVQVPGDLHDLAVHGDDAGGRVELRDGQGGEVAPAQAAVGGGGGHQLVPAAAPAGTERVAERGDFAVGGDLGGVDPQRGLSRDADRGCGKRATPGLPVHLGQPRVDEIGAVDARADQDRDHPPDPVALAGGGGGI
jgi:hypothetical protein